MKNRDKYMKEIYDCLSSNILAKYICLTKKCEIKKCYYDGGINDSGDCDECCFFDGAKCIISDIEEWLEQEAEDE